MKLAIELGPPDDEWETHIAYAPRQNVSASTLPGLPNCGATMPSHRWHISLRKPVASCTGYLDHPFKNKPCEAEKDHLPRLANTGWSVYNQTSSTEYSCSNNAIFT